MTESHPFDALYAPVLAEIEQRSQVTDAFIDKDVYRVYLATLWANAVLDPARAGLEEAQLEGFFDYLNDQGQSVLGGEAPVLDSFRYLLGRDGERALERLRVPAHHRAQLLHFAGLMLDGQRSMPRS